MQQGEYAQGLQLLREAHARTANDARVRYHLAVALHHLGRNKEAREELRLALATDTHFEGAEQALSLLNALP